MCAMISGVLGKCSGVVVRPKEVVADVRGELPELLPSIKEAEEQTSPDEAFTKARLVGNIELAELLKTIRTGYEEMPFSGPPPEGSVPPQPPDWGAGDHQNASKPNKPAAAGGGSSAVRALGKKTGAAGPSLTEAELTHLSWMSRVDEDGEKENLQLNTFGSSKGFGTTKSLTGQEPMPAHTWMVIYGGDFADIAKDLPAFRRLFQKCVSAAIGLPMGCIEVLNVVAGSIVVEFLIHPACRGNDTRDAASLVLTLEQQLSAPHSALRRGAFAAHAESAELLTGNPSRAATPVSETLPSPLPTGESALLALNQALMRAEKAEAMVKRLELEMEERDLIIKQLRAGREDNGYGD